VVIHVAEMWGSNCPLGIRRYRLGVRSKDGFGNQGGGGADANAVTHVGGALALKGFADVAVAILDPWHRWLVSEWTEDGGRLTAGGRSVPVSLNGVSIGGRGLCGVVYSLVATVVSGGRKNRE